MKRLLSMLCICSVLSIHNYPYIITEYETVYPSPLAVWMVGVYHQYIKNTSHISSSEEVLPLPIPQQHYNAALLDPQIETPLPFTIGSPSIQSMFNQFAWQGVGTQITVDQAPNHAAIWTELDYLHRCAAYEKITDTFLKQCSVDDFVYFAQACEIYTLDALVTYRGRKWWQYKVFWDYIESVPGGHEAVFRHATYFLSENVDGLSRAVNCFLGTYTYGAKEFVQKKYAEHNARYQIKEEEQRRQRQIHYQQEEQRVRQKLQEEKVKKQEEQFSQVQQEIIKKNYVQAIPYVHQICDMWRQSTDSRLQARAAAYDKGNQYTEHKFVLHANQRAYFTSINNNDQWDVLYGTALQKQLHQELLDVIDGVSSLEKENESHFKDAVDLAYQANRAGYVDKACTFTDLCYAFTKGICKGTLQATKEVAYAFVNPLHTTITTLAVVAQLAKICTKTAYVSAQLAYYYATDENQFYTTYEKICDYNRQLYHLACDYLYNTDPYTLVCEATALVTEMALAHKGLALAAKVHTKIAQECVVAVEVAGIPLHAPVFVDESALKHLGIQLFQKEKAKIPSSISQKVALSSAAEQISKNVIKVHGTNDFMKNTAFGKYLSKYSGKVKGRRYDNQQIYMIEEKIKHPHLKKGDYFYLDGLHKNHIEVFRGSGSTKYVCGAINCDGILNIEKTNKSIAEGRFIKV